MVKNGDNVFLYVLVELLGGFIHAERAHHVGKRKLGEGYYDRMCSVVCVEHVEYFLNTRYTVLILFGKSVSDVFCIAVYVRADKVAVAENEVDVNKEVEVALNGIARGRAEHKHNVVHKSL